MAFWLAAVAMAVGVAALLARAMLRGGAAVEGGSDLDVYRDQLAEVERDRARGLIGEAEAARLHTEVSRRLLDADRKAQQEVASAGPGRATRGAALAVAALMLAGGVGVYLAIGAPGYPDLPIERRIAMAEEARANRPGQEQAEASAARFQTPAEPEERHARLMEQLRATLEERPNDLQGYTLLARNEAGLGNFVAARRAQERVLELKGDDAGAADWADYALLLVYAAGGYVSPKAEMAVDQALEREPENGAARYLKGLLHAQSGRPDLAFGIWRPLLEAGPKGAPWEPRLRGQIREVAQMAGVDYRVPNPSSGPSRADMAAAAEVAPEDRQAMIRGMVEGLAGRLAEEGGTAEEWARLINALGVLGELERAGAIYDEAREVFASSAKDLAVVEDAAERAGIAQ